MVNDLYAGVAAGLKAVKNCTVYREDVPQGFRIPCFMVTIIDQNPSRGINGRLKNEVSMDILYFPQNEGKAEGQEECWEVGQSLTRELVVPGFKIRNRNLKITDRVLHFTFDVSCREFREETTPKMQEMSQNMKVKEE